MNRPWPALRHCRGAQTRISLRPAQLRKNAAPRPAVCLCGRGAGHGIENTSANLPGRVGIVGKQMTAGPWGRGRRSEEGGTGWGRCAEGRRDGGAGGVPESVESQKVTRPLASMSTGLVCETPVFPL